MRKLLLVAAGVSSIVLGALPASADDLPNGTFAVRFTLARGSISSPLPDNRSAMISANSPACRIGIFHQGKLLYLVPSGSVNGLALGPGESVGNHPTATGDCVVSALVFQYAVNQDQKNFLKSFKKSTTIK